MLDDGWGRTEGINGVVPANWLYVPYRIVELFPSFEAVVSERDGQSPRPEIYATNELTKREDTETRTLGRP